MVTTGTKHAVNCGDFHHAWREWRRTPAANQTWANCKTHWTRALQENRNIQKITGGGEEGGVAGNTMEGDLANQLVNGLDNLANAAVQKNETVKKLITMNE
jgi:outer membrane lipopolysaccharide assembly protein LptE/RlpB